MFRNCGILSLKFDICTENWNKSPLNSEGNTMHTGLFLAYALGIPWGSQNLFPV